MKPSIFWGFPMLGNPRCPTHHFCWDHLGHPADDRSNNCRSVRNGSPKSRCLGQMLHKNGQRSIRIAKDESKSKGTRYWMILIYHNIYKFHHIQPKNLLVSELQVRANTKPGLEEGVYSIRIYSRERGSLKHERSQSLGPMFSAIARHRHQTIWVKESIRQQCKRSNKRSTSHAGMIRPIYITFIHDGSNIRDCETHKEGWFNTPTVNQCLVVCSWF